MGSDRLLFRDVPDNPSLTEAQGIRHRQGSSSKVKVCGLIHNVYNVYRDEKELDLTTDNFDVRSEIEQLKIAQATQAATLAGAQATQAASQAGMAGQMRPPRLGQSQQWLRAASR